MLNNLVRPGDWWLFIPSILSILLLGGFVPLQRLGWLLLAGTTCIVALHYGLTRGLIHIATVFLLSRIFAWGWRKYF